MENNSIEKELIKLCNILHQYDGDLDAKSLHRLLDDYTCSLPYYVAIVNPINLKIKYFCPKGLSYLALEKNKMSNLGFKFINSILNVENIYIIEKGIAHFIKRKHENLILSYKVKKHNGEWKWFYSISKYLWSADNEIGFYTVTILCEMQMLFTNMLEKSHEKDLALRNIITEDEIALLDKLSKREKEVLICLAEDNNNEEISTQLSISIHTVKNHKKSIYSKLKTKSVVKIIYYGLFLKDEQNLNLS